MVYGVASLFLNMVCGVLCIFLGAGSGLDTALGVAVFCSHIQNLLAIGEGRSLVSTIRVSESIEIGSCSTEIIDSVPATQEIHGVSAACRQFYVGNIPGIVCEGGFMQI